MNRRAVILTLIMGLFALTIGAVIYADQPAGYPANLEITAVDPGWFYEEIDVPGFYFGMGDRSLRFSAAGVPYLVYGASHLYLARYLNGVWTSEIVDGSVSVGEGASLALDANNRPHIAYKDTLKLKLKYAHWNGAGWQIQTLADVVDWNLLGTAIDLDPAGRPHIVYGGDDAGSRGLFYAYWDGSNWQREMVNAGMVIAPSIAVDNSGKPHISFSTSNDTVKYGRREASSWIFEDVGADGEDFGTSIALDSLGDPHIAYLASDWDENTDVMYAVRGAGIWTETLIMGSKSNIGISLIMDVDDKPHIADSGVHLSFDGIDWHEEPIAGLDGTFHESIALDQAGRPIISALTYGGPFQCAHHDGDEWIVDELAYGATTGEGNALAVSSDGQLRATYYDRPSDQLIYAIRQPGGWFTTTIVTNADKFSTDLALDAGDSPHVCASQYSRLDHVFWDGADWVFERIDNNFDDQCTLAIDSTGQVQAAYLGSGRVQYALRTGDNAWQSEGMGEYDETVDLALDGADRPHLVYFDGSGHPDYEQYLLHAVLTGSDWLTDTVDGDAWVNAAAIAIDENEGLHVAYFYKDDACELRYARRTNGQWQIETVAEKMCQGEDVEIGLDADGRPHILYWVSYYLGFAVRTDEGWQNSPLAGGRVYDHDMVIDGNDTYISFTYEPNRGLLLASSLPLGLNKFNYLPAVIK